MEASLKAVSEENVLMAAVLIGTSVCGIGIAGLNQSV